MADQGFNLRAAREAAGLSLSAMSARTHYSKALLGHLEIGRRAVKPEHVTAYSRALDVSVDHLLGSVEDPLRVAHEWLLADAPPTVHISAGRRVGAGLAAELERRVTELRHLDDVVGGVDLSPAVSKELADARRVVAQTSHDDRVGRRLLTVVGELAQLAGWVASDAGRHVEAERAYLSGVSAARQAGDRALAGQLLSSLSYQMANVGNPADAVLLARSAVRGAGSATPVARALLLERVAWASSRARDPDGTRRALDEVEQCYDRRSPDVPEPGWVYWLDQTEIDVMAGRCLIELGDPERAAPLLSRAVAGYAPGHSREIALYLTWLAESYARAGVLDAAHETIERARRAGRSVNSARLARRIGDVDRLVAGSG